MNTALKIDQYPNANNLVGFPTKSASMAIQKFLTNILNKKKINVKRLKFINSRLFYNYKI